jgi:hypothetical protein
MASRYTVADGDTIFTIAEHFHFSYWETIYYHADNAQLRKDCPDPFRLKAGVSVAIPDRQNRVIELETDKRHTVTVRKLRVPCRLVLTNDDGKPLADVRYRLSAGGHDFSGRTSDEGVIEQEVPTNTKKGTLSLQFGDGEDSIASFEVIFTHGLPASDRIRQLQYKLNLLGFDAGPLDGELNDETKEALMAFKVEYLGQEFPDDQIDDDTARLLGLPPA